MKKVDQRENGKRGSEGIAEDLEMRVNHIRKKCTATNYNSN